MRAADRPEEKITRSIKETQPNLSTVLCGQVCLTTKVHVIPGQGRSRGSLIHYKSIKFGEIEFLASAAYFCLFDDFLVNANSGKQEAEGPVSGRVMDLSIGAKDISNPACRDLTLTLSNWKSNCTN